MPSNVGYIYGVGQVIPGTRFRVRKQLGIGGMGSVYEVASPPGGVLYVIKVLHPHLVRGSRIRDRFRKEAHLLTAFDHKNIVQVAFTGETAENPPLPFYVMERLHGRTVADLLAEFDGKLLPLSRAISILIGLLSALEYAHGRGVVHRDVKPENVFLHLEPTGEMTVKLLDFGIVRIVGEARATTVGFVGTLATAAPEQLRNEDPTPACDIYAAGMTFYELLTGRGPFGVLEDEVATVKAHLNAQPTPASAWRAVPQEIDALVLKMIAKNPHERPSATAILTTLQRLSSALRDDDLRAGQAALSDWSSLQAPSRSTSSQGDFGKGRVLQAADPSGTLAFGPTQDAPARSTIPSPSGAAVSQPGAAGGAGTSSVARYAPGTSQQGDARSGAGGTDLGSLTAEFAGLEPLRLPTEAGDEGRAQSVQGSLTAELAAVRPLAIPADNPGSPAVSVPTAPAAALGSASPAAERLPPGAPTQGWPGGPGPELVRSAGPALGQTIDLHVPARVGPPIGVPPHPAFGMGAAANAARPPSAQEVSSFPPVMHGMSTHSGTSTARDIAALRVTAASSRNARRALVLGSVVLGGAALVAVGYGLRGRWTALGGAPLGVPSMNSPAPSVPQAADAGQPFEQTPRSLPRPPASTAVDDTGPNNRDGASDDNHSENGMGPAPSQPSGGSARPARPPRPARTRSNPSNKAPVVPGQDLVEAP